MVVIILLLLGLLTLTLAVGVFAMQQYRVTKKAYHIDEAYNGPAEVSVTVHAIIRFLLRRSVHFRKFCTQYVLHLMVRGMYYLDIWSSMLYAKSRNWFVKNAVRNRGTVPHFWQHLKVYKQEMDQEKEEKEQS